MSRRRRWVGRSIRDKTLGSPPNTRLDDTSATMNPVVTFLSGLTGHKDPNRAPFPTDKRTKRGQSSREVIEKFTFFKSSIGLQRSICCFFALPDPGGGVRDNAFGKYLTSCCVLKCSQYDDDGSQEARENHRKYANCVVSSSENRSPFCSQEGDDDKQAARQVANWRRR